jgi:hypothetical protein
MRHTVLAEMEPSWRARMGGPWRAGIKGHAAAAARKMKRRELRWPTTAFGDIDLPETQN